MNRHFEFIRTLVINGLFYGGVGFLPWLQPYLIQENILDKWIGFHIYSIYVYISFFFLIWYCFMRFSAKEVSELSIIIPISAFFAAIFYLICPTTIVGVSQILDIEISDKLTHFLYYLLNKNDTHMNCLPSLHGAITVMCLDYLLRTKDIFLMKLLYIIWSISICWSAIAIRQHLSLDIILGMVYGFMILCFKSAIMNTVNDLFNKLKNDKIQ